MQKRDQIILSISNTYQLISYSVYRNYELVDWDNKCFKERCSKFKEKRMVDYISNLIELHKITHLLFKRTLKNESKILPKLRPRIFEHLKGTVTVRCYTYVDLENFIADETNSLDDVEKLKRIKVEAQRQTPSHNYNKTIIESLIAGQIFIHNQSKS